MYRINNLQFTNLVKVQDKHYMVLTYANDWNDQTAYLTCIYECNEYGDDLSWWGHDYIYKKQIHAEFNVAEESHKHTVENAEEIVLKALVEKEKERAEKAKQDTVKIVLDGTSTYNTSQYFHIPYHSRTLEDIWESIILRSN